MNKQADWDARYEWRVIVLLTLGFGLVGLDRFAVNPLFPAMMKELHLNYRDLGNISAVLALAWGLASTVTGPLSDRLGRRRVLIPSVTLFSLMSCLTGFAGGIGSLLFLRLLMGLAEGAFVPASIAATVEASKPSRRGLNFGFQQNGLALIGLGLGPILVTQLLLATGSWRLAFLIVSLPGLIVAYLLFKVLRDTQGTAGAAQPIADQRPQGRWGVLMRNRNIVLAALNLVCIAGAINAVVAMAPSYLVEYLKLTPGHMGFVMSGFGAGALALGILLPALSDRVGRRPIMFLAALGAGLAVWAFMKSGANPVQLFLSLGAIAGCGFSAIYVNNGPFTIESVPAALSSSAVGLVVGCGEIVGGTLAPAVAGHIAQDYGIEKTFLVALLGFAGAVLCVLLMREPSRDPVVEAIDGEPEVGFAGG